MLFLSSYYNNESPVLMGIIIIVMTIAIFVVLPRINWSFLLKKEYREEANMRYQKEAETRKQKINQNTKTFKETEKTGIGIIVCIIAAIVLLVLSIIMVELAKYFLPLIIVLAIVVLLAK